MIRSTNRALRVSSDELSGLDYILRSVDASLRPCHMRRNRRNNGCCCHLLVGCLSMSLAIVMAICIDIWIIVPLYLKLKVTTNGRKISKNLFQEGLLSLTDEDAYLRICS